MECHRFRRLIKRWPKWKLKIWNYLNDIRLASFNVYTNWLFRPLFVRANDKGLRREKSERKIERSTGREEKVTERESARERFNDWYLLTMRPVLSFSIFSIHTHTHSLCVSNNTVMRKRFFFFDNLVSSFVSHSHF